MRLVILATLLLSWNIESGMEHAFYPVLLLVLLGASFGVPIPEDVPLLAAGFILAHRPDVASWWGTLAVGLVGILAGDIVLFLLGRRWGPEVCRHRWVKWLITPQRLERTSQRFQRYGTWMCFFGRFFMGVRAAMCMTAGVLRFPLWRFVAADASGALLSMPLFVWLGYWFANMIPTLRTYVHLVQWALLGIALLVLLVFVLKHRRQKNSAPAAPVAARPTPVTIQQSRPVHEVTPTPRIPRPQPCRTPGKA